MKKILTLILVVFALTAFGQSEKNFTVRNKLTVVNEFELNDSSVGNIQTGDTLATTEWTRTNAAILTGNDTEIFFNEGGVLGSSPRFTYNYLDSTLVADSLELANGEKISWNTDENTINIPSGFGSTIQAGQEIQIKAYNNTGSIIPDGKAVSPNAIYNSYPSIGLIQSDTHETFNIDYGLTTTAFADGGYGFVVWFGKAHDQNTSAYSLGDVLYVSSTVAGELTNVKPEFPNYAVQMGLVLKIGTTDGIIFVTGKTKIGDTFQNFWNGVFRENFEFLITETGGVITGTLTPSDGRPDLTMMFSDGFTMLDTDPGATITLTAGTDINPTTNYVYIPESTKVLTVNTSDWITAEHIKVAQVLLQSAVTTGLNGGLRNQNWNDALESTTTFQGHLSHITERIRQGDAIWDNGIEATGTIITASTPDDVWVSTTTGEVYQMHKQTFTAKNTQTGDSIFIVNHPTTAYDIVNNLNTQLLDASGTSLNNTSFSFVLWGVNNKTSEPSHLMINLPSNSYAYAAPSLAISDASNYSVYTIPKLFQGVGFLIARFTYTYKNDVWTLEDTEDLRGYSPNTTAGGGAGGTGVTTFLGLSDTPSSYTANTFQVANSGATALGTATGITYNDSLVVDGNIHADTIKASGYVGIGTTTPLSALHLNKGFGSGTGISWSDGDAEIYENLDDDLYFDAGGVIAILEGSGLRVSGSLRAIMRASTPSATNPAFSFFGNTQLGIGRAGADAGSLIAGNREIARWAENVTEQFIINPQGDLTGTAASPNWAFGDGDTGGTELVDDELTFTCNSIEAMRLTEDAVFMDSTARIGKDLIVDGNVGIGIINPNNKLHVYHETANKAIISESGDAGAYIGFKDNTTTDYDYINLGANGDALVFNTGYSERMRINAGGNISIGNTNDTYKLDVSGTGRFTGIVNFDVFPVTPNSAPTTDYQVANKKYVDDNSGLTGVTSITETFLGVDAGRINTGTGNTFLGYGAAYYHTSGTNNVFLGLSAGNKSTDGDGNTIIGSLAGFNNETGSYNIFVGTSAGYNETGSHKLYIDNSTTSTPLIYGEFDNDIVKINGTQIQSTGTITDNDATPNVSAKNVWTYAGSANSITVTDLDNPDIGAIYRIIGNSDTYTITINDSGNFNLSANWIGGIDDVLTIFVQADNDYIEISRSDN